MFSKQFRFVETINDYFTYIVTKQEESWWVPIIYTINLPVSFNISLLSPRLLDQKGLARAFYLQEKSIEYKTSIENTVFLQLSHIIILLSMIFELWLSRNFEDHISHNMHANTKGNMQVPCLTSNKMYTWTSTTIHLLINAKRHAKYG